MTKKKTTEEFIRDSKLKHGEIYDYSAVVYVAAKVKVILKCREHGEWLVTPNDHTNGSGCPSCGIVNRANKKRKSEQLVRESILKVHGGTYSYKQHLGYVNKNSKIDICCSVHGWFSQTVTNHVGNQQGCPRCCTTGYQAKDPGSIYILTSEDNLTKVGISNSDVKRRCRMVSKSYGKEFKVLKSYFCKNGKVADLVETIVLKELRRIHESPVEKFHGHSECFYNVNLPSLINRIEELIALHTKEQDSSKH